MKKGEKNPKKITNKTEINNLPERVQSISKRMLNELRKIIDEQRKF